VGQQEDNQFFEVQNYREYTDDLTPGEEPFQLYLRYDNQYNVYKRQTYSLLDYLGDIGGLIEALMFFGHLSVVFFS
jgi:hypothetical protein